MIVDLSPSCPLAGIGGGLGRRLWVHDPVDLLVTFPLHVENP